MDSRIALQRNTVLHLRNNNNGVLLFTITKELGRGGSCIVYEAFLLSNTGDKKYYRIKECYPYKLKIDRSKCGKLIINDNCKDSFLEKLKKFENDFTLSNKIFYVNNMYSYMPDQLDLFNYNNTKYVVSTYSSEKTLATYKPKDIKECVSIVKKVAYALTNIHKQGYLFLDIKPSNILVIEDLEHEIKLLDFDSLVKIKDIERTNFCNSEDVRLLYTKGFAPVELEVANVKRLGAYTDVFSVGALLYWLLFNKIPLASDCEADCEYNYSLMKFNCEFCDSKLFVTLSDFFHSSLSSFYLDRYQNMLDAFNDLDKIEKLADATVPRIISSNWPRPKFVFGRSEEFKQIDTFINSSGDNVLFIKGIGGIGKSTLIREYLYLRRNIFDIVLYVNFVESIENTITNDYNIEITNLNHNDFKESDVRYFDIKLKRMKELVRDIKSVLVIDNFSSEINKDVLDVINLGCKVIFVSREVSKCANYPVLNIDIVKNYDSLQKIFEANLGKILLEKDEVLFKKLANLLNSHTLLVELIAKQISSSYLSIEQAIDLVEVSGISGVGKEKIYYEKDGITCSLTIKEIIKNLFKANKLSNTSKNILKVFSLMENLSIDICLIKKILRLDSYDKLNNLVNSGWLLKTNNILTMHPIIVEYVRFWEWEVQSFWFAQLLFEYYYKQIKDETQKINLPKYYDGLSTNKFSNEGFTGKKRLISLLNFAEELINNCIDDVNFKTLKSLYYLYWIVVLHMPRFKERSILYGANLLIESDNLDDKVMIIKLYRKCLDIYLDKNDNFNINKILTKAKLLAKSEKNCQLKAIYYDMLSNFYDTMLNGAYSTETEQDKKCLKMLLHSINKGIKYSKKFAKIDDEYLYIKNLLAKATILIRVDNAPKKEIMLLLKKTEVFLENISKFSEVWLIYYLVKAWYCSLILKNIELSSKYIELALDLSNVILSSDIDFVDITIVPCANIYYELKCKSKSIELLQQGIEICEHHANIGVYDRLKQNLCSYLEDIQTNL